MVEARYEALGTPARFSLVRKAVTPAFVCVSTRIGLGCACAARVSAINCVLPQPAGAVTEPLGMARRSISSGTGKGPELVSHRLEPRFSLDKRWPNYVFRDLLVGRQRLKPPVVTDSGG